MARVKEVIVRSVDDICDALSEHSRDIFFTNKLAKKTKGSVGLIFVIGMAIGIWHELRIKNLEAQMNDTYEETKMREQLESQEEKILQLELELEDLKKKE